MQKPMILALLLCRKNHCCKIYANLHSPAFKIGFQLVFYTSITLRHCNTLSFIDNSPTTKAKFPINVPTMSAYILLTSVKHVCSTSDSVQHPNPALF